MGLNKAKTEWVWCTEKRILLADVQMHSNKELKSARCPLCNKQFEVGAYDCEYPYSPRGAECWHPYIPPHKKKVKIV